MALTITTGATVNTRAIRDINYIANVATPNAANTAYTNAVDLQNATPYPVTQYVIAQLIMAASATGANSKNLNVAIQDSADNSSFTNVAVFSNPVLQVTDNAGAGWAAKNVSVLLPPTIRRYVRGAVTGEANGMTANASTLTFQLLF